MAQQNKIKIGLALGGGSALGFAHIGILKALEENDIQIDFISGTSAGAIVGALYAFGVSFKDIEKEAENLDWKKVAKLKLSKMAVMSNAVIKEILERNIGNADISIAKIPLAIVCTDVETGAKVVFKSGNVVDAVLASACLPGLFPPIEMNGLMLIDGGITENVPISPIKDTKADIVIAINLMRYRKYKKPKNIIGVILNSLDMINHRISTQPQKNDADILIEPDLKDYAMNDIEKWQEISEKGYRETLKHIEKIKELQNQTSGGEFWKIIKKILTPS
jgi:NTE family protein